MAQSFIDKTPCSIAEAAKWSGYSQSYLRKLIHTRKIPFYKPDASQQGKVFLCKEEIAEFIFRNRQATASELNAKAENILNGGAV